MIANIERILKLRSQDKSGEEIAKILNDEGLKSAKGNRYSRQLIHGAIAYWNKSHKANSDNIKRIARKENQMITLPVPEPTSKKMMAIVGGPEEIHDFMKMWVNHG